MAALVAVAAAALPYWWPVLVRAVPGVSIGDTETLGWTAVELRDVTYEREGLRVTVDQARVPAFGWWPGGENGPPIRAAKVVVEPQPVTSRPPLPPSIHRVAGDVLRVWPELSRWLPPLHVAELEIVPSSGGPSQRFRNLRWDGARVSLEAVRPGPAEVAAGEGPEPSETTPRPDLWPVTFTIEKSGGDTLQLTGSAAEIGLALEARARWQAETLEVDAQATWRDNAANVTAAFGETGLLPERATVEAPSLTIPASDLSLAAYGTITGSIRGEWTGEAYTAAVVARADPVDTNANLPPLAVDLQSTGNFTEIRVQAATVNIPGVDATLSAPLVLALPAGTPAAPAQFAVDIDLAQVPQIAAEGRVTGRIDVAGGPGVEPAAAFSLTGAGIRWRDGEIPSLAATGRWTPATLALETIDLQLAGDSRLEGSANLDLAQRSITRAQVTMQLASAALKPWLPQLPEFTALSLEASAEGPWSSPTHQGRVSWRELAGVPGGTVDGELTWSGEGVASVALEGQLVSGGAVTLPVAGTLARAADGSISAEISQLAWHDVSGEWWQLARPVPLRVGGGEIVLEDLELTGESISVSADARVRWPSAGAITISAAHIVGERLGALLPAAAHAAVLDAFDVRATWEQGPVQLEGSLRASYTAEQASGYYIQSEFRTEADDLALAAVRVYDGSGTVLEGEGRLPLRLTGTDEGFGAKLPTDGELLLDLHSVPNPGFWTSVSQVTGWEIAGPALQVQLAGSIAAPRGRVIFDAEALQPPPGLANTVKLPRLGDLSMVAEADARGIAVTRAYWTIDGHWVSLTGRAPWTIWRTARESGDVPWREAEFSFAADRMPLSIASRAVPRLFASEGNVSFEMKHAPATGLSGFLWLDGVALRPIQPLGAVRDIGGSMTLEGYRLRLERLSAFLGGQPITIAGETNIENLAHPVFEMSLQSSRVPLVRQEGLVLRAELDLRVEQTAGKPAHISGDVDLARSVFVSDLVGLLPTSGSVTAPEQRPPFFSVPQEPFATWTLDVALRGEDFLRIQNPFFRGEISADFKLTGTLAEPRAIGRAWSDEGAIIFPFGQLAVQQAEIVLTPEQPHALVLHAQAGTRIYGYDVRLEVSGTAQDPRLLFSSDPPLTSQQLFLMLSAGELPTEDNSFSTSERAQRLALFVGRNLASTLGIGGGGDGGDRLIVRSGEDFSREGGETLYVQYNLDGRWSIVAEKDRFDAYNGGIKFRLIDR